MARTEAKTLAQLCVFMHRHWKLPIVDRRVCHVGMPITREMHVLSHLLSPNSRIGGTSLALVLSPSFRTTLVLCVRVSQETVMCLSTLSLCSSSSFVIIYKLPQSRPQPQSRTQGRTTLVVHCARCNTSVRILVVESWSPIATPLQHTCTPNSNLGILHV